MATNELSLGEADTDIEEDDEYDRKPAPITDPFDPRDVNIQVQTFTVSNVVTRMDYKSIQLTPDFQRHMGLWTDVQQSRLIESLIIRIPLPTFYFDSDKDDVLTVVDGLQRLYSINRFMGKNVKETDRLRLTGLEYLKDYEGRLFKELPINIQMRINETNLISYVIRPGTPENVRISIFTRINTGGIHLTMAEIRNSVYRGRAANLLKRMAECEEFKEATNGRVHSERMLDREFANRFLAFYILSEEDYHENLEEFLNLALNKIKYDASEDDIRQYEQVYKRALNLCIYLFGESAFRKIQSNGHYGRINKPLFECVTVTFARCSSEECNSLKDRKELFSDLYTRLLHNDSFVQSITNATAKIESVHERYTDIRKIIDETLHD